MTRLFSGAIMDVMAFAVKPKPLDTPLATGRNAAFAAIKQTLAPGERVARRDLRAIG